ncbi:MAG: M4 family metallopeptidase [Cyclobacteriaceae bacterium]
MKNLFTILMIFFAFLSQAQEKDKRHTIHKYEDGTISAVKFSGAEETIPTSSGAFFKEYLEVKPADHFKKVPHISKREGFVHEHYDQYYFGIRVQDAGYNFHYKNGQMYYANGHYVKIDDLNTTPAMNLEQAIDIFLKYKEIEKEEVVDTVTELLIKEFTNQIDNDKLKTVELVYRIYLESDHPNNNEVGYINAHTGQVVETEPRVIDFLGTFATRYNGTQQADTDPVTGGHRLFDDTRGANIHTRNLQNSTVISSAVELIDNNNNWTATEHSTNENDMGLDIHWALQEIYDYINNEHSINSFDDSGFSINAYIRFGSINNDRDNAFWDPTPNHLVFGDGAVRFSPVASLDVVAHEFGHGITDFQIGWGSSGDPRAFNEGLSDIWGAILEQRISPSAVWRIGEDISLTASYERNIENTNDANARTQIADTYQSSQYNGTSDFYVRSGVFSHWFYVLVEGESGTNDLGNSYSVNGIGMGDAEDLIVEAVFNNYLDNTTTYPAIRTAVLSAAEALFGANSCEVVTVTNAWHAVGVGSKASIYVNGDNVLCSYTTDVNYELENLDNPDVTWSVSPSNLVYNASGTGSTAPLRAKYSSSSGQATLIFTDPCTGTNYYKIIWVGKPKSSSIEINLDGFSNGNEELSNCELNYADAYHPGSAFVDEFDWDIVVSSDYYLEEEYGSPADWQYVEIDYWDTSPPTTETIKVRAHNTCGWSTWKSEYWDVDDCGGYFMIMSPNPSSDYIDVTFQSSEPELSANMSQSNSSIKEKDVVTKIYDQQHNEIFTKNSKVKDRLRIDTSTIQSGHYIIKVFVDENIFTRHLLIE